MPNPILRFFLSFGSDSVCFNPDELVGIWRLGYIRLIRP